VFASFGLASTEETPYFELMPKQRQVILLTGFGPFPGVPENASALLVRDLEEAAQRHWPEYHIQGAILPTEWRAGPATARELLAAARPVVTLHFGVSRQASGFTIETRGLNFARPVTDAAGLLPPSERLAPDGPEELVSNFPAQRIVQRLRRRSLPAVLSHDAGGYLCNAVLYHSLDRARQVDWPIRCGFVHLPASLSRTSAPDYTPTSLDWEQAVAGGLEIIAATIDESGALIS